MNGFKQSAFYFGTRVVLVVQNTELGMASFTVKVKTVTCNAFVEIDSVLYQLLDTSRSLTDSHFDHFTVADAVTCNQSVLYMFIEAVTVVHDSGNATLGIACRAFGCFAFTQHAYFSVGSNLESKTQSGNARPYNQKINFVSHFNSAKGIERPTSR